jgi:hypothetical protein
VGGVRFCFSPKAPGKLTYPPSLEIPFNEPSRYNGYIPILSRYVDRNGTVKHGYTPPKKYNA